ncbi:MAG TPA: transposase [Pyrinomonadaceae bacterium]|nr:transposase [Pyrinomonadaceae bacterium]
MLPLAFLITFRCYGTWLHGDERGSIDRHHNVYGTELIPPNERWEQHNTQNLRHEPVILDASRRAAAEAAVRETCEARGWLLRAVNVRTNHVHAVVSADCRPEPVLKAFKANATRMMRERGCWPHRHSPWAEGGSRRYLWTERSIERAVAYVVDGQDVPLPDFNQYRER